MADNQNTNQTQPNTQTSQPHPTPQARTESQPRPEPQTRTESQPRTETTPVATINEISPAEQQNTAENTAVVNEDTGNESAANVNEDVSFDTLSVSEQQDYLNILEEKNKQGLLSVSEKAILDKNNEDKKKTKDDKKIGDFGAKDGDENQDPDKEKKGPFKEKDVIKYMYEDWLLEGANWLWCKTATKLDKGAYWAQQKILERMAEKRLEKNKTYETEARHEQVAKRAISSGQANMDAVQKHEDAQLKNLKLLKEGKYAEANVSDTTKVLLENMSDKEKEQFFKISEQGVKNFYNNVRMAEQFASNYAQAGMTLNLAKDKDHYQGKDLNTEFDKQKAHAMQLFARRMDMAAKRGEDPMKVAAKLFNMSKEALDASNKTIEKRKFSEADKKPNKDKTILKNGNLVTYISKMSDELKTVATPEKGQKRGMYEAAVEDMNFDKGANLTQEQLNQSFAAYLVKKDQNDQHRNQVQTRFGDRIALLKQKFGFSTENIDEFTQIYNRTQDQVRTAERNQRMADTLSGPASIGRQMMGGDGR